MDCVVNGELCNRMLCSNVVIVKDSKRKQQKKKGFVQVCQLGPRLQWELFEKQKFKAVRLCQGNAFI